MNVLTGISKASWHPVITADTTTPSYWLNWRVLVCSIWIMTSISLTVFLISRYEGPQNSRNQSRETQQGKASGGVLYEDELWKPCLRGIHPVWLLAYRLVAFFVLLVMLSLNGAADGGTIFCYYTQWTFTLITIYFGLGSLISMFGCYKHHKKVGGDRIVNLEMDGDSEQGTLHSSEPPKFIEAPAFRKEFPCNGQDRELAGFWGYVFQVIFQMNAGAVVLTDCVFWFIIVPFLTRKDYDLNFLLISMHSINVVFLLGEAALNSLRFPWFRIAYFFLWTTVYVVFQWILHSAHSTWWPYPFLDLSNQHAPLWYLSLALLHIPCYGIFVMIMKLKHSVFSRSFGPSYHGVY
ncbi:hypothetical protein DCAR_0518837 [Daucus carota subsp. sativus]|uniref:Uncharacterized protein n=1 Tax=Daucus carota subsp. sativus TaxID=79200 RepID=A0AAF0X0F6_DAUCS|nr:PREDICTED: uncharacterized protein LOC108219791 isoform X1 [Daucus carota subsp. sativus]WOG99485.1 hypothetical protein DCAR_0518837 [Daucus carota subsp. sativus]